MSGSGGKGLLRGRRLMRRDDHSSGDDAREFFTMEADEERRMVHAAKAATLCGERALTALDEGTCATMAGVPGGSLLLKQRPGTWGAFASLGDAELNRRIRREGGLKHTENASLNPRCARAHRLFSRHHPWVTGLERTQCSICGQYGPLADIRFHCTSKLCGGAQACKPCATRYGPELATALLLAETSEAELLPLLATVVERLVPALRGGVSVVHAMSTPEMIARTQMGCPLEFTRDMLVSMETQRADALMEAHDEAQNTEAFRVAGRMQCARLARVVQELQHRLRNMERALRALDKEAAARTVAHKRPRSATPTSSSSDGEE